MEEGVDDEADDEGVDDEADDEGVGDGCVPSVLLASRPGTAGKHK